MADFACPPYMSKPSFTKGSRCSIGRWGGEDLVWRILDVSGGQCFALSEKIIDCRPFHSENQNLSWAESDIRAWLNGEFLQGAFNAEERRYLNCATLQNPDDDVHGTSGGGETEDTVFLMSAEEVERLLPTKRERVAGATEFAKAKGLPVNGATGGPIWWLRTQGHDQNRVLRIYDDGGFDARGWYVELRSGVRPVVCLTKRNI